MPVDVIYLAILFTLVMATLGLVAAIDHMGGGS
jgi:hypothetical protein